MKYLTLLLIGVSLSIGNVCAQMDHMHEHGNHKGVMKEAASESDFGICPVMREPASGEYLYEYNGKTYYFCCPMCIEKFKQNPDEYISKIKEVNLEAYQFGFSPDTITVKKGDIVKLLVSSRDVAHGVYIEEYGINVPISKDKVTK
jgi:YHS domain-containing protein